jgi:hypothetical protein
MYKEQPGEFESVLNDVVTLDLRRSPIFAEYLKDRTEALRVEVLLLQEEMKEGNKENQLKWLDRYVQWLALEHLQDHPEGVSKEALIDEIVSSNRTFDFKNRLVGLEKEDILQTGDHVWEDFKELIAAHLEPEE